MGPELIPGDPSSFLGQKNEVQMGQAWASLSSPPAFLKHPSPGTRTPKGCARDSKHPQLFDAEGAQQFPPAFPSDEKEKMHYLARETLF